MSEIGGKIVFNDTNSYLEKIQPKHDSEREIQFFKK